MALLEIDLISPVSPSYTKIVSSIIAIPSGELSPDTSVSVSLYAAIVVCSASY